MLTPQEVSEHTFTKSNFGGYNMAMVDEFLDVLTADYSALYKENAVLKSKMKVLVDKVEEYRSTEDAMRKALMTAQKMADELVEEAKAEKATLLHEAEEENKGKLAAIRQEVEAEQFRLTSAQNATTAYIAKLKELYRHEQEYLEGLSKLAAPAPKTPDRRESIAQEIEASLEKKLEAEAPAEPAVEEPTRPVAQPAGAEEGKRVQSSGIYDDILELTRQELDASEAARQRESVAQPREEKAPSRLREDEEVTAETRRIPSREDLMDGLGFGRR